MTEEKIIENQISLFDRDSSFGKMFPERCRAEIPPERTSESFSKKSQELPTVTPLFLDLRIDGPMRGLSWETGGLSLGEYTTVSFGESPNVVADCRLSQILEVNPSRRYYLSAKACQGILNRASEREKELPEILSRALKQVIRSKYGGGVERDSKGKKAGKGPLVQEEKSGTLGVSQDQTVITYVAPTLDLWAHSPTCNQGGIIAVYGETSFSGYSDKNIATLRAQGGHNGGGSENLLVSESCQETVGALCSGISKGTSNQIINQDQIIAKNATVRRLTPLECERLQGFPDGWTDIGPWTDTKGKVHKESSDTARYKALGNSIAVGYANEQKGFWIWLMKRISERYGRVATLGSLFDGIGGFPLAWEYCNGKGTAIWASEIEEFPIAVTKYHFPEGSEIDV